MSRFADPTATDRLSFGACQCPGAPHTEDWMEVRTQLGAEDATRLAGDDSIAALLILIVGWNFLDNDGSEAPVDRAHVAALFHDQFNTLNDWVEKHVRIASLPNASAVPSRASSRGSGSHTPTPKTAGSSMTSSSPSVVGVTTTSGSPPPPS